MKETNWSFQILTVIAIKKDDKFLLLKRSKLEICPSIWEFPAGNLELLEKVEEGALREVREETGLKITGLKYLGYHERYDKEKKTHKIFHDFFAADFEGEVKLSEEHDDYKWLTKEEILKSDNVGIDTLEVLKKLN